jgi:phytoene/squalene synthetase
MTAATSVFIETLLEKYTLDNIDGCPILELGARVWEEERYRAFKICYQTMRWVDDCVDHRKALGQPIPEAEKQTLAATVKTWMLAPSKNPQNAQLQHVREKFLLPVWPWQRWTHAMLYDLEHDGFAGFADYLRYCEGAAVAPGAIFMHLCALRKTEGIFSPPAFDIRRAARPLAIFAYLVHIVRDFQKDQLQNLNYFSHDLVSRHGLNQASLREIAEGGAITPEFRALLRDYHRLAGYYRKKARAALDKVAHCLETRYALSLEIIYSLYLQIFERLDDKALSFADMHTASECSEVLRRVQDVISLYSLRA